MRKRMLKKLKPSNLLKFLRGNPVVCSVCGEAGGTLVKDRIAHDDGLYHHEPNCPNEQSPEMKAKLEELKKEE